MAIIKRQKNITNQNTELIKSVEEMSHFLVETGLDNIPLNIEEILQILDIELVIDNYLDDDISGYIRKRNGQWTIGVNSNHHVNRQRFTIAHELGHYILHSHLVAEQGEMKDGVLFRDGDTNNAEVAANQLASELLMPENQFRQAIKEGIQSIDDLANKFGVSSLAVRYRAKDLGYEGHGV